MQKKNAIVFVLLFLWIGILCAGNRTVAEWEPMRGVLIRHPFGIPINLIWSMAETDTLYILVQNNAAQNQAINTLSASNVNLAHCVFITAATNSHWTRDWGPQSVFVNDQTLGLVDQIFDGYPWVPGIRNSVRYADDNAVNPILAAYFGMPVVDFPAYLTGGNFMSDGRGVFFSTAQMLSENFSLMFPDDFIDLATQVLGANSYHFTINPELHGIQHIDCWAKLLDEDTVLVKELPVGHPEYDRAEQIADQFASTLNSYGKLYRVIRIFCDTYSANNAAAYTNSLILNNRVYVPLFGIAADQQAMQTYMDAMPGYEILGFTGPWYYYDALHCRAMGIADGEMLRIDAGRPDPVTNIEHGELVVHAGIRSYGEHELVSDALLCHYRINGSPQWSVSALIPGDEEHVFGAAIAGLENADILQYYFVAADASGRIAKKPLMAPEAMFSTTIQAPTGLPIQNLISNVSMRLYPRPARAFVNIALVGETKSPMQIQMFNLRGQLVHQTQLKATQREYYMDLNKNGLGSGIYFVKLITDEATIMDKLLIIK